MPVKSPLAEPPGAFDGVVHEARPAASEVKTLPAAGAPPVILICPATSSFAPGVAVPMPTSPAAPLNTLLATRVNGERLDLDHGYPLRLVGPNRPGVMQTKWVSRLVVR